MPQPPSIGTLSKFAAGLTNPPTSAFEYVGTFGLGLHNTVIDTAGIRGTRQHPVERTRPNLQTVSGPITMNPGPGDLNFWLTPIMGQAATGAGTSGSPYSWTPADKINTYGSLFIGIDRLAQQHLYSGCQVNQAVFRATQGAFLELEMDIQGLTESVGASVLGAGFAALIPSLQTPYVLSDASLTYGGTTFQFRHVEVVISNGLKLDRFMNSVTRTDLPALDLAVSVSLDLPYTSDELSLYNQNATAGNVVLTFTNSTGDSGSQSQLQFQLPATQFPTEPPITPGRDEILLPLRGRAMRTGTTPPLTVTNY